MEQLKSLDPEQYARRKAAQDRQQEINRIVGAYQAGRLTADAAETQLRRFVVVQVAEQLAVLDYEIAQTTQRLHDLQEDKRDPERLMRRRIDRLLGRATPAQSPPP